jgi:urease accessory protein
MTTAQCRMQRLATAGGAAVAVFAPAPVLAHVGDATPAGFVDGLLHPMLGIDHLVAMVAVGVLAVLVRRPVAVPAAFVVGLLAGAGAGLAGVASPLGESAIALSVLVLGLAVAAATALRVEVAIAGVALAGALHGNAHGLEAPATRPALFVVGFVVATVALHIAGGAVGVGVRHRPALRSAVAGAVAAAGLGLVAVV